MADVEEGFKALGLSSLILFTFLGNCLVLAVIFRRLAQLLSKPLYVFICNICVADVLSTLFVMTFEVSEELTHKWMFGEVACKTIEYLEISLFGVNIFSHVFIALERYRCVVQPLKPQMKLKTAKKLVFFSWCFPFIICLPSLYMLHLKEKICTSRSLPWLWLDKLVLSVGLLTMFLIPWFLIMFMYMRIVIKLHQRKKRADVALSQQTRQTFHIAAIHGSRVSVIVATVFLICWMPLILVYAVRLFKEVESVSRTSRIYVTALYSSFMSELLTPFIYCAFDRKIGPAFFNALKCRLLVISPREPELEGTTHTQTRVNIQT